MGSIEFFVVSKARGGLWIVASLDLRIFKWVALPI